MNTKTIALVCDFDDTLCHDSTSACLAGLGVDVERFWNDEVLSLIHDGWDPVPAYFYKMVELSREKGIAITRETFLRAAKTLSFYPGVTDFFRLVREYVTRRDGTWTVEFYLISSGIADIVAHCGIAPACTDIWAGEFLYGADGCISFPKRIVSFTDKTRYLFQISKGMVGETYRMRPFEVNKKIPFTEMRIPFERIIYLGDGYTDIPCFALLRQYGGYPIAVYDDANAEGLKKVMRFREEKRVVQYGKTNYTQGSELFHAVMSSIDAIMQADTA